MRSTRWPRRRRTRSPLRGIATLVAIAAIAALAALFFAPPTTLAGRAIATDGDSLRIGDARIRLLGLDAVELIQTCERAGEDWPCGREAHVFLRDLLTTGETQCSSSDWDQYGRALAYCTVDGVDVGDAVVRAGWAVAELQYASAQAHARSYPRGIWTSRFVDPAEFRRHNRTISSNWWDWVLGILP